ncbi:MAG: hypothetical protein ACREH6_00745 [Geminicoccaceae bacterium]
MHRAPAITVMALLGIVVGTGLALADERMPPYTLDVQNAAAKVGERTAVVATVRPPQGFHITPSYRARVIELSAWQDRGVAFDDDVVIGTLQDDDSVVFKVGVTPTERGAHPINGVIRVSFYTLGDLESKSVRLEATVTGTE